LLVCRYAVKYNEQLLLTLEEDEFSCKQRLAYKLEQVSSSEYRIN
jgi:plexin A